MRHRIRLHLAHDLATMSFDGDFGDAELGRDVFVQPAADHELHHLPLATAELLVLPMKRTPLLVPRSNGGASLQSLVDRAEQRLFIDGRGENFDRAGLHRLHDGAHARSIGDENDGQVRAAGEQ